MPGTGRSRKPPEAPLKPPPEPGRLARLGEDQLLDPRFLPAELPQDPHVVLAGPGSFLTG